MLKFLLLFRLKSVFFARIKFTKHMRDDMIVFIKNIYVIR